MVSCRRLPSSRRKLLSIQPCDPALRRARDPTHFKCWKAGICASSPANGIARKNDDTADVAQPATFSAGGRAVQRELVTLLPSALARPFLERDQDLSRGANNPPAREYRKERTRSTFSAATPPLRLTSRQPCRAAGRDGQVASRHICHTARCRVHQSLRNDVRCTVQHLPYAPPALTAAHSRACAAARRCRASVLPFSRLTRLSINYLGPQARSSL